MIARERILDNSTLYYILFHSLSCSLSLSIYLYLSNLSLSFSLFVSEASARYSCGLDYATLECLVYFSTKDKP